MRRAGVLILMLVLTAMTATAQMTVVSGIVTDGLTRQPVQGASVTDGEVAVVTNADGRFVLKSPVAFEHVTVSHVGYKACRAAVPQPAAEPLHIVLTPTTIMLHEVLVMADNPRELVRAAIGRTAHNYSRHPELYHCFYRETAMKRQHYICVAEGVVDMYKTGYTQDVERDRVAIRKGRRLLSPRQGDTLSVKVMGGPVASVILDVVKNADLLLTEEELDCYDMRMEAPTTIGDRQQFVVGLMPRRVMPYALYFGRLYIDQQTLAFTRVELSLDMTDYRKATDVMLVRKPAGVRFRPKELSLLLDYRTGDDGLARMSYLRTAFRFNCDWKRRLLATQFTAVCEMAVTSVEGGSGVRPIRGRESFDQRDAFFDRVDFFRDLDFWQQYNIIEPTESLDRAVLRLMKKVKD